MRTVSRAFPIAAEGAFADQAIEFGDDMIDVAVGVDGVRQIDAVHKDRQPLEGPEGDLAAAQAAWRFDDEFRALGRA